VAARYGHERAQALTSAIQTAQAELEQRYQGWIVDAASRFHLSFMALIVAAYRALSDVMPKPDALTLVKRAVIEPTRDVIQASVRTALDAASDPMRVLVEASKQREVYFFGRTFGFERRQDDDQAYLLLVTECFYHRFAVANAAPELMTVLCQWDWIWADAISPKRHGFSFELPTTLGYGGDACRFCFRRLIH